MTQERDWVEPWQPKVGQFVRFRMGERREYVCPSCGYQAPLDPFAALSGRVFVVQEVRERLSGDTRCVLCNTVHPMEPWLQPYRFLLGVQTFRWNRQIVGGFWAAGIELVPADAEPDKTSS
ncbi:MAG: hypothetical protein EXR48_02275 [Dehalococcoidia bacterium]|nr:hypothetical protein [Dehalococcoidia bacterium]